MNNKNSKKYQNRIQRNIMELRIMELDSIDREILEIETRLIKERDVIEQYIANKYSICRKKYDELDLKHLAYKKCLSLDKFMYMDPCYHFQADKGVVVDGDDNIVMWLDQSGNDNHATKRR